MQLQVRVRSVGAALRFAESVLLAPGQRHARRNAWTAVCENREHAADRRQDADVITGNAGATGAAGTAETAGPGAARAAGPAGARSVRR
ncbi:hypothetical protein AB0O91_23380 [Kitasatospora sp. NPDC089797]|uniref:hypothetical protein n=1 Tax=Kitasatospora sp. NPDC089797 TaxID=3155298 RepID=UPI00343CDD2A